MRKLSRTRLRGDSGGIAWIDRDNRPQGIPGATVTSKPNIDLDLSNLSLRQPPGATVTASEANSTETKPALPAETKPKRTLSLSDGTEITFATIS